MKHPKSFFTLFSGLVLLTVAAIPTFAIEIKYNTVGTFSCNGLVGCTATTTAAGSTVIVKDGAGNQSKLVFVNGADDSQYADDNSDFPAAFGAGVVTPTGTGKGDPFSGLGKAVSLDIKVFQTIPSPTTTGDFIGTVAGKVGITNGSTNSTAKITFGVNPATKPTIILDGVVYELDNNSYVIDKVGTSIQGTLDGSALPEPAFFALTGIGFFGMFVIAWSRYKQRA